MVLTVVPGYLIPLFHTSHDSLNYQDPVNTVILCLNWSQLASITTQNLTDIDGNPRQLPSPRKNHSHKTSLANGKLFRGNVVTKAWVSEFVILNS